jgi:hypothetical protein
LITGLRAIWKGSGNKFYVTLFVLLSGLSVRLFFPIEREFYILLSTVLFGGIILFLLLSLLALIPQFNKLLRPVERSDTTRLASFSVTMLLAVLVYFLPFRLDHELAIYGFQLWLVVQALLSCTLAYSLSDKLSSHRPHALGWIFLALALLAEFMVYLLIRNMPPLYPLFVFYSIAWFAPCVVLALVYYGNARSFSAYCIIALIYTIFPVAYRVYSILDDLAVKAGHPPLLAGKILIDELLTILFFIWALNGIGSLLVKWKASLRAGEQPVSSEPRGLSSTQLGQSLAATGTASSQIPKSGSATTKEPMLGLFLIFGLLFSALAYFVFVNAGSPLGIQDKVESTTAYTFSILATIPLLFYMAFRKNKRS